MWLPLAELAPAGLVLGLVLSPVTVYIQVVYHCSTMALARATTTAKSFITAKAQNMTRIWA